MMDDIEVLFAINKDWAVHSIHGPYRDNQWQAEIRRGDDGVIAFGCTPWDAVRNCYCDIAHRESTAA